MLLRMNDDLRRVTTLQNDLIRDLLKELEKKEDTPGKTEDITKPAIEEYKRRAEEAQQLLDIIEYNSRRL